MNEQEFQKWFLENLDRMVDLRIMHYNTDRAKDIHAMLSLFHPELERLNAKVLDLEIRLEELECTKARRNEEPPPACIRRPCASPAKPRKAKTLNSSKQES